MRYRMYVSMIIVFTFLFSCEDKTTNPVDNNFESVTIGSQVWMKKNLEVDHYRNGDSIPEVRDSIQWMNLTTGAWCYYNNSDSLGKIYGKLYNWYAVNDPRGLAPSGYHVASDAEWEVLTNYLGDSSIAGGKLKEVGTTHWLSPNEGATNSSGFSALPGGFRNQNGSFSILGFVGCWWSATEFYDSMTAYYRTLFYSHTNIFRDYSDKVPGFSVRCVRD